MQHRIASALVLAFALAACEEEAPPPPPPTTVVAQPASQPASMAASAPVAPPKPKTTVGPRVLKLEGSATVDGAEAYEGMAITETSVIETKAATKMTVTAFAGSAMQVRENSKVQIGHESDFKKKKKKEWSMKLLAGSIWSFLPKGSSYEVQAPNAVAGARGTVFYVQTNGPDDSYVCDCDGEVEVTVAGKKKPLKSKMAHVGFTAKGADKKAKGAPTKQLVGHDKAEVPALVEIMNSAK